VVLGLGRAAVVTSSDLTTLNCTQCGAGLSVYGGGRVKIHVCSYCGSALDAQHDYKVLARYDDLPRPRTPFKLGSSATLLGVKFTVIGTIAWQERYQGQTWRWVDHQVFSPTHGYAWLTWEDGEAVFTRKVRGHVSPAWYTESQIEHAAQRPHVRFEGQRFAYYDSGRPRPTFVEGEFNYVPTLDARPYYASFLGKTQMLKMVGEGDEREYELSELLPREATLRAMGANPKSWPASWKTHPLKVFERHPVAAFARNALLGASVAALILAAVMSTFDERISRTSLPQIGAMDPVPFSVTQAAGLVQVDIETDIKNGWVWLEGEITNAGDEVVAAFEDGAEYYTGRDSEGRWSEGSRRIRVRADLPIGDYVLSLTALENVGDKKWSGKQANSAVVSIRHGVSYLTWLISAGVFMLVCGSLFLAQRGVHSHGRWSGSDWVDEDD
jgi:hypothetical protein